MKLNNKGTSLIELLVSMVLISVVIIFMFRLLVDLNNEQTNSDFAIENQVQRAEIMKFIANDLDSKTLVNLTSSGNNDVLNVTFTYKDNTRTTLALRKDTVDITAANGEKRHWTLKNCTLDPTKAQVYLTKDATYYALIIEFEIHTLNDNNSSLNNNPIDDITVSYFGLISDYNPANMTCLGNKC